MPITYFVLDANSASKNPKALSMAADILKEDFWYGLTEERLKPHLAERNFLLAIEKGKAVSYIEFEKNSDLREIQVLKYFTRESHRRKGIIKKAVGALVRFAHDNGFSSVVTHGAEPVVRKMMARLRPKRRVIERGFGTYSILTTPSRARQRRPTRRR